MMNPVTQRVSATLLAILVGLVPLPLPAQNSSSNSAQNANQNNGGFQLTIDNIMRGPQLYGYMPESVRWSGDGKRIYFDWKDATQLQDEPMSTWELEERSGSPQRLPDSEARLTPPYRRTETRDHKKAVFIRNGDLFVYDYDRDQATQLTATVAAESNPHFNQDETLIAFTLEKNLYTIPVEGGLIRQITDIRTSDKKPNKPPEIPEEIKTSQEFLIQQENELIGAIRRRREVEDAADALSKQLNPREPVILEARESVDELYLCPDETCVLALIKKEAEGDKGDNVPNYVTNTGYTAAIDGRNNVGDKQDTNRMLIIDAITGAASKFDTGLGNREAFLYGITFNPEGTQAAMIARAVDNKNRWILTLAIGAGKAHLAFTEHDDAWVNWPDVEPLGFLDDKNGNSDDVYFISERDGWAHLYRTPADADREPTQLTSGNFEVETVELSRDRRSFYMTTSEGGPEQRHFWRMSVDGGKRTRITAEPGRHDVTLSPNESRIADVYSYVNRPPELFTASSRPGSELTKRTTSPAPEFFEYPWIDAPIVQVPARDGARIPARIFKPENWQPGGPAVVFVHGAGYLQNVHKYWSPSYPREFLFHHLLMEHGYLVLDMDYRASAGYGRDWRTAIYRHMGGKDLEDNVDGARWLVSEHGVDPARIGIYGGSYGGFITLMAMFTTPDVFAAGAALRPVTDWSHYNHGYTSNILNTPQDDPEAFRQSSPIYFADGLKGALLIAHGMVDTNVFFQDTVRLVQRLIELRKENWDVAFYPVENHAFQHPESWADEYKRIFKLFEENLK